MSIVNEYNFYLDSKYRTGGTNPAPKFNLKEPIVLSNPMHYFKCRVKSCEIPYSFKSLVAPFNTLRIRYNETGHGDTTGTITIEEGNYNINTLLLELKTKILDFISNSPHQHIPILDFTYDKNNGKCILTMTKSAGNNSTYLYLYWSDLNTDILAEFFGFTGNNNTILSFDGAGIISNTNNVSEIHVNCSPISSIYIRGASLTQPANNEEYLVEFQESTSDILLKVPVQVPFGSWIIYQNIEDDIRLNNTVIDSIDLYLTHLTYNPISLDGVHWRAHIFITEIKPDFVREIELKQAEEEAKINEMENMKQSLLQELEGIKGDLSNRLAIEKQPVEKNPEELKQEFMAEIQQNKISNLN
jgi:hypothetical protein